ncbi:MAG: GNAT family protein [Eubacteriales bacterium]|nr:GNAT family protein [Eubacteriales bacterium]
MEMLSFRPAETADSELFYRMMNMSQDFQSVDYIALSKIEQELEAGGYHDDYLHIYVAQLNEEAIGLIYLYHIREGLIRMGIQLEKEQRGKGYGRRLIREMAAYLFANTTVERLEADTDVENLACQKAFSAAGFTDEARLRHFRFHHGRWHDSLLFSLLREDWLQNRNEEIV